MLQFEIPIAVVIHDLYGREMQSLVHLANAKGCLEQVLEQGVLSGDDIDKLNNVTEIFVTMYNEIIARVNYRKQLINSVMTDEPPKKDGE